MNTNNVVWIGIVAVIIVVVIMFGISKSGNTDPVVPKDESKIIEVEKNETSTLNKSGTVMASGSYEIYTPEKAMLASATHDVVLFFKASWCPTCIAVDKDIKANLANIPSDLAILEVNYDNSSDLKKKYGVTYQHTFVQVDKDGNMIKKWSGSPTLAKLIAEVK